MKTNKRFIVLSFLAGFAACSLYGASPYISKVFEYRPAPGQFVNEIPEYESGDTYDDILVKAEEQLCGAARPGLVTLGAYGGYVTFGFDHRVLNKPGDYDFRVNGNAIISDRNNAGGSCEPGIILVSVDANGNGLPDDEWYEIKGSEYDNPATLHDYTITYYRPEADHQPSPDPNDRHIVDAKYIRWTSSDANASSGYLQRNDSHAQSYWPLWLADDVATLSFSGERLAPNATDTGNDGSYFLLKMLGEGYADNMPSVLQKGILDPGVKIDWAVKADGTPANLDGIDFVRVYTAMNQTCGWIGETSTEVSGAEDLHPDYLSVMSVSPDAAAVVALRSGAGKLSLRSGFDSDVAVRLIDCGGRVVATLNIAPGENTFDVGHLGKGVYIVAMPEGKVAKVIF